MLPGFEPLQDRYLDNELRLQIGNIVRMSADHAGKKFKRNGLGMLAHEFRHTLMLAKSQIAQHHRMTEHPLQRHQLYWRVEMFRCTAVL